MIGLRAGISLAIVVILCAALGVIGWGARAAAERTIAPEILAKADSVGRTAAGLVERAHQAGVPLDRLVGVSDYFADLRADNAEIARIALLSPFGAVLAEEGSETGLHDARVVYSAVTARSGAPLATIAITVDPSVVSQKVGAVLIDVAFIGLVSLLVALELVALVVGSGGVAALTAVETRVRALARGRLARQEGGEATVARDLVDPIDQNVAQLAARHAAARAMAAERGDQRALDALHAVAARTGLGAVEPGEQYAATIVRPALFLFMLAEELTRPFLPRFAGSILPAGSPLSPDMAVALPIVAFMAIVALCQIPFAGLSERLGRRSGFLIGALIAALGYALSALTLDYYVFLAARCATALGYGLVFVSAQGHVIDHADGGGRAAALAVFVRAIMVACLCGPPIGGVIADRLGAHAAFNVSAGLALVALVVAALILPGGRRAGHAGLTLAGQLRDVVAAAKAPRLMALLVGCAFPAKLIFAALSFYLVPVELQRLGYSAAAIGRFQMIYPVAMVLFVPLFAALADKLDARARFVALGGVVAGAGALLVPLHPVAVVIAGALLLLGIGQAMSIAPQSALVADVATGLGAGRSAGVLGLFRLVERSGNALGPALAGVLLTTAGFAAACAGLGGLVVAGAIGFALSGRDAPAPGQKSAASAAAPEGSPL